MTMVCDNCGEKLEGKYSKLIKHKYNEAIKNGTTL